MTEKRDGADVGKLATTAATTIIGGFLLWAVLNPFNASKESDNRRDSATDKFRDDLASVREEYRGEIASLRADVETVKSRTRDSFSSKDFEREDRRIEYEIQALGKDINRLEGRIDRVARFLAEQSTKRNECEFD
jgi:hypothetical protein